MKILLLTGTTPCDNFTAGLVLSAMVRLVPRDEICIFSVLNPALDMRVAEEFSNIPVEIHAKPNENWSWLPRRRFMRTFSAAAAFAGEKIVEAAIVPSLIRKAVKFGRQQKVDRVWAVLEGQTTIRIAEAVARKLGVPLYTHVWDPFSWWAKAHGVDRFNARHVQSLFDRAIAGSRGVATASWPMAELYKQRFGVAAVPVIASHHRSLAQSPEMELSQAGPLVIGMAGQFYAANEWLELLKALRAAGWQVAGRKVRVVVLGPQQPPGTPDPNVSFLGWKSQKDAAFILSQCDILYCPYPFDPGMREVSQYSFPSKLVLYLLASRPIVFHGPDYSSPAKYIRGRGCGLVADGLHATSVYNELERLLSSPQSYAEMAANARAAFMADFTLESMDRAFNAFIGGDTLEEGADARLHDHRLRAGSAAAYPDRLNSAQRKLSLPWLGRQVRSRFLKVGSGLRKHRKLLILKLSLKIPRLRSLYHEIHSLYAEKAILAQKIDSLESENARLKASLRTPQGGPDKETVSASEPSASSTRQFAASREFLEGLYPASKMIILADLTDAEKAAVCHLDGDVQKPIGTGAVLYTRMPASPACDMSWTDDWMSVAKLLPEHELMEKLHLILANGIERVAVEDTNPFRVAFALELARLASCRVTVVSNDFGTKCAWLQGQVHIDYARPLIPLTERQD